MRHFGRLKNNLGFTLGEMMTSVAIIGILASLTIPHYMRYRMETNMELVRQHMRLIAEKMVEILGKESKFPSGDEWQGWISGNPIDTPDEDELAITASLGAIDDYCYTVSDYQTDEAQGSYRFCSAPQSNACGKNAGYKRFCVHYNSEMASLFAPGSVGELPAWDGTGTKMWFKQIINGSGIVDDFLADEINFTNQEKGRMIAQTLANEALYADYEILNYLQECAECNAAPFSTFLLFDKAQAGIYEEILPQIYSYLDKMGIHMQETERDVSYALKKSQDRGVYYNAVMSDHLSDIGDPMVIEISFSLSDRVETEEEYMMRRPGGPVSLGDIEDVADYYGYDPNVNT